MYNTGVLFQLHILGPKPNSNIFFKTCRNGILLYSEEKQQDFFGCLARFLGCPGLREADNPEI